jgi:hypothetical protein
MSAFVPVRLIVYGKPAPQGSKKPVIIRSKGGPPRAGMMDQPTTTLANWRPRVHDAANRAIRCQCPDPDCDAVRLPFPLDVPVQVSMAFYFERPATHFKAATRERAAFTVLREDAPLVPATRAQGDTEKLARAVADGLQSGRLLADDGLIARYCRLERLWAGPHAELQRAGAIIWVMPWDPTGSIDPRYPDQLASAPPALTGGLFDVYPEEG